ncbi:MAG: DUF5686 family protein [Cytophagales bacterium]|nr:DUF5686 and carboxypeptidase regulatory-like domain-containing protein [Bernardetiaceae bacterium]MDW8205860.1 DUF5686 family protein [Cytophagales bacterium]
MSRHRLFIIFVCIVCAIAIFPCWGQITRVSGKITDAETGDAMPFVNVLFKGTTIGTTTDFEGNFSLQTHEQVDSLIASYLGYQIAVKPVQVGKTQVIHFQLKPMATVLQTVVVRPGDYENPAWEILRGVIEHKDRYNYDRLSAYQYESYTKLELAVDNISDKFRQKKIIQQALQTIDSAKAVHGDDGKPILPVFFSETISEYFYRKSPERKREIIHKTKVSGIGVTDGSVVSQVIGSTFQQYNFYRNWLHIAGKDFISPIADGWKGFYEYELKKSDEVLNGRRCFRIEFQPKRPQDLAFSGVMWIADSLDMVSPFALLQIDVSIGKAANLNFVEKIKIQQELALADSATGVWLPAKNRILVDIGDIKDDWAGLLAKSYSSNRNFKVNFPHPVKFYEENISLAEDALQSDDTYWEKRRHDSLSSLEKQMYQMIDTIKNLPVVKTYVEIADLLINGFHRIGKLDWGLNSSTYAFNDLEGHRIRLQVNTNYLLSRKFILHGAVAYGTADRRWKFSTGFDYILSRKPWTQFGYIHTEDYNQLALFSDNFLDKNNALFMAFTRWGNLSTRRPFFQITNQAYFQTDIARGFTHRISFNRQFTDPLFEFEFIDQSNDATRRREFIVTELAFESRIAFGEKYIQRENKRLVANLTTKPIITLRYACGIDNLMGSDFGYHKFQANITQRFPAGALGNTTYSATWGYIPTRIPYPLLAVHLGNETIFYNSLAFNMMRFFEFVSNHYFTLHLTHRFEGLMFNRIPLIRQLKWRTLATANMLYGSLSESHRLLTPTQRLSGEPLPSVQGLGNLPYIEVGYGIENILRFIRVDFIHRLTYLDSPQVRRFGVKISAQFRL